MPEKAKKTTVKPRELIEFGLNPAVLWNVDREKEIDSSIFIVATLKNGYNKTVISKICGFFGDEKVLSSLKKYRHKVSDKLMREVEAHISGTTSEHDDRYIPPKK